MTGETSPGMLSLNPNRDATGHGRTGESTIRDDKPGHGDVSVLLIDDSDDEAREIVAALMACGSSRIEVEHVSDPKEAEDKWRQGRHDLVIVDVWLGNGVSVELVTLLTSLPCVCPIVMLSSLSAEELHSYFLDSDLFIHSKQNITPGAFAETLQAALCGDDGL